jgi:hypothetical protein
MRDKAPKRVDQNYTSGCVGHGSAMAIAVAFAVASIPLFGVDDAGRPNICSPQDLYVGAMSIDRKLAGWPNTRRFTDDGTEVLSAIQFAAEWGVRRMTNAPLKAVDPQSGESYEADSDCVPATATLEPTFSALEMDAAHLVPVPHQIVTTGPQRVRELCLMLDAGHPVVFGTFVATPFMVYVSGVVGAQNQQDPNGGGHCMCLLGYYTQADGQRVFYGVNSWGTGWGELGDFECSEAFVAQLQEMFAIVATKEEA